MARAAKGDGGIYRHGDGWRVRVTIDGKRVERRASSKSEANQIRKDLLAGGIIPQGWTVDSWLQHWLDKIAVLAPSTRSGYEGSIRMYIKPAFGHMKLDKLRAEQIEKLYASMRDGTHKKGGRPLAGNTIGQVHAILHRALKIAYQRGHVARNIADMVNPPSRGKPKTESLSAADTRMLLQAAMATDYAPRWALALMKGIRPGEALGITWDRYDGKYLKIDQQLQNIKGKGVILRQMAKSDAGDRGIELPPFIVELIDEYCRIQNTWRIEAGDGWKEWSPNGEPVALMFTMRDGGPILPRHDSTLWARLVASAGLPHTRRYTARHTAATLMLEAMGDVALVSETLGHRDSGFTYRTYVHTIEAKKAELAQAMNAFDPRLVGDPLSDPLSRD